tara:strand:- start:726 stop:1010 length:285 start_codon:yes stop_codon:yes gene_type:complete
LSKRNILNRLKRKHPQIEVDQIGKIYEKFIELISQALLDKKRIEIRSLGIFYTKPIKEKKNARNPKTGEKIYVPEKLKIRFKASKELQKFINTE